MVHPQECSTTSHRHPHMSCAWIKALSVPECYQNFSQVHRMLHMPARPPSTNYWGLCPEHSLITFYHFLCVCKVAQSTTAQPTAQQTPASTVQQGHQAAQATTTELAGHDNQKLHTRVGIHHHHRTIDPSVSQLFFKRLQPMLNVNQSVDQAGSRQGYSTTETLFTFQQLG